MPSLKQAIPAASKSEVCNTERQKWVVPVWALTADPTPELDKTIGRLVSIHIVDVVVMRLRARARLRLNSLKKRVLQAF